MTTMKFSISTQFLGGITWLWMLGNLGGGLMPFCQSFTPPTTILQRKLCHQTPTSTPLFLSKNEVDGSVSTDSAIEVVLFGIGDLRTDDHEGLHKSLERAASKDDNSLLLPIVILDEESMSHLPGAVAHTEDTANMIVAAVQGLQESLAKMNLQLCIDIGSKTVKEGLENAIKTCCTGNDMADVRIHVCDHGPIDNQMGYLPCSSLQRGDLQDGWSISTWNCHLRDAPFESISTIPDAYNEYTEKFSFEPIEPITQLGREEDGNFASVPDEYAQCPSARELSSLLQKILGLNSESCQKEINTGLYGTHWGGLDSSTVEESKVLETMRTFAEDSGEDDETFAKLHYVAPKRNEKSLEHATMVWNFRGDGSKTTPETKNIIAGELMTRYLLAPLFLGTVSPRRIWYSVKKVPPFLFASPLRTLVETREWHKLLAAKQLQSAVSTGMAYKYWRWHGFLCRYGEQTVHRGNGVEKEGILLIHGFGASANQWQRKVNSLSSICGSDGNVDTPSIECLAPDLIGFGQSEKPPITYSGFTWEAYTSEFIKEVACQKNRWGNFVIGGNSIGGFVGMCAAANDATTDTAAISGCGTPGTGRCTGAMLMNPAGVIQGREDVEAIESAVKEKSLLKSVAQVIAQDGLAPCKPLPRPVARAFGSGLLAYLRPRIQSICVRLYPTCPEAVDDALCQNILRDSLDPGAINVMISGSKLPSPRTYNEVIAADFGQSGDPGIAPESQFRGPILLAQGVLDPLNDAKGRAKSFQTLRKGIKVVELQGGHCPHDEIPDDVAATVLDWMKETRSERKAILSSNAPLEKVR